MLDIVGARPYQMNPKLRMEYQDWFRLIYPEIEGIGSKVITSVVTEWCNLRCTYCYELHKNNKKIDKATMRKIVDALFEEDAKEDGGYLVRKDSESLTIEFIGGEPLLAIDEMDYFMEYFRWKAINLKHRWAVFHRISITTNGTLYLEEKVQRFIEKYKNNISITITIDGNKELHDSCRVFPDGQGSYDIVERAVKKHVQDFTNPATKLTLAPQNISYLVDAVKNLESLGIKLIYANPVFEKGWAMGDAKLYYQKLKELADYLFTGGRYLSLYCSLFEENLGRKLDDTLDDKNWCGGTGDMMAIGTDGVIYPCLRYLPFAMANDRPSMAIGHVDEGIGKTKAQATIITELKEITRTSQSEDKCNNCPINEGCAWCSAYNYDEFGTVNKRATYICDMHKARVLANVYYWNTLYRKTGNDSLIFENNVPKEWALDIIDEPEFEMLTNLTKR